MLPLLSSSSPLASTLSSASSTSASRSGWSSGSSSVSESEFAIPPPMGAWPALRSSALEGGEGDGERDCYSNDKERKGEKVRGKGGGGRARNRRKERERTTASISSCVLRKPKGMRKVCPNSQMFWFYHDRTVEERRRTGGKGGWSARAQQHFPSLLLLSHLSARSRPRDELIRHTFSSHSSSSSLRSLSS